MQRNFGRMQRRAKLLRFQRSDTSPRLTDRKPFHPRARSIGREKSLENKQAQMREREVEIYQPPVRPTSVMNVSGEPLRIVEGAELGDEILTEGKVQEKQKENKKCDTEMKGKEGKKKNYNRRSEENRRNLRRYRRRKLRYR